MKYFVKTWKFYDEEDREWTLGCTIFSSEKDMNKHIPINTKAVENCEHILEFNVKDVYHKEDDSEEMTEIRVGMYLASMVYTKEPEKKYDGFILPRDSMGSPRILSSMKFYKG